MANITALRITKDAVSNGERAYKMKADSKIWGGGVIEIASGYAQSATKGSSKKYVGVAKATTDNTGGAAGDVSVIAQLPRTTNGDRLFKFDNDPGGGALTQANVGTDVYLIDDHTVSSTATTATVLGEMTSLDADGGIWVLIK